MVGGDRGGSRGGSRGGPIDVRGGPIDVRRGWGSTFGVRGVKFTAVSPCMSHRRPGSQFQVLGIVGEVRTW